MMTQEFVQAAMQEHEREAVEAQRQRQARESTRKDAAPTTRPSRPIARRIPIVSFLLRAFPTASAR